MKQKHLFDDQLKAMLNSPLKRISFIARVNSKRLQVYYGFAKRTPEIIRSAMIQTLLSENINLPLIPFIQ